MSTVRGYPDWQRYAQWMGAPLVSLANEPLTVAGTQYGPFTVGNWRSLLLAVSTLTQDAEFVFWGDIPGAGGVSFIMGRQGVWSGYNVAVNIPVHANTVRVVSSSQSGAPGQVNFALVPNNLDPGYRGRELRRVLIGFENYPLAAGGTLRFNLPAYAGRAHVWYFANQGPTAFTVEEVASAGTTISRAHSVSLAAGVYFNDFATLGTGLNRLTVVNSSGVGENIWATVIGEYHKAGEF